VINNGQCIFCGSYETRIGYAEFLPWYYFECESCGARGPCARTAKKAMDKYDNRLGMEHER
jgi:translation initiation factor 2 beta subunit (eIF-2beta)/eIF-5